MNDAETPPESCFIDTNLWLYAFINPLKEIPPTGEPSGGSSA
jgi:hypothetical protein